MSSNFCCDKEMFPQHFFDLSYILCLKVRIQAVALLSKWIFFILKRKVCMHPFALNKTFPLSLQEDICYRFSLKMSH